MFCSDLIERKNTIIVNLALFHHMWQTYRDSDQYYDNVMKKCHFRDMCIQSVLCQIFLPSFVTTMWTRNSNSTVLLRTVRKRWWFRNFPPPYSLIYFQNPTDSSFINTNDFSPLDSSSHQGIEQSVWILKLLYWHNFMLFYLQ